MLTWKLYDPRPRGGRYLKELDQDKDGLISWDEFEVILDGNREREREDR
jgi:hypothetical protein